MPGTDSTGEAFKRQPLGGIQAVWSEEATERLIVFKAWLINQLAFMLAILAIYVVESCKPTVSKASFELWIIVAIIGWVVRGVIYVRTMGVSATEGRRLVLVLPYVISALSFTHWAWTVSLFLNSDKFSATATVIYMVFTMMSIAMASAWPHAPVASTLYVVALWTCLSVKSLWINLLPGGAMVAICLCMTLMMVITVYSVMKLRPLMTRNEAEARTVSELRSTNATLEAMRSEASATLKERSAFFAGASHDFKQRLHAMKLMAYSTIATLPPDNDARWALSRMSDEVEDLERYFKQILEFARIEALDITPTLERIPLQKLMQKADLHFEGVAKARSVNLTFRTTKLTVVTDPVMLQRMLENLVSNALKFTRRKVVVAARTRNNEVVIEVWDQGPGIDESQRSKIFQAFHQSHRPPSREEPGVGLGLALVKRFADRLNCRVTVSSKAGQGSVFRLHIPAAPEQRAI
ncbi:sensor histidine kinase [Variovorax ginsengisoli]|uniref:histidine kinase n=1 Tax=Variovorax ginsengisoli TaxID=363844 RepID=A0ABT9SF78_9BURK|nr:HAMP domain-containing sensor histidine kinase [Variovorax ginsengisoli]MDP9902416.1 signal transduction histidine kinase [Variovorax ginsengisoli]